MKKLYFIVGSQDLYGEECLKQVAEDSRQMVEFLNGKLGDLAEIELLPTVETSEICIQDMRKASNDDDCVGVITWMHTFSPAKMWIKGLQELRKPLLHLHTQANEKLPYDEIDMDFMNLNQSAHGDREYGFIVARMGIPHEVVAGYYKHDDVVAKIRQFASVAKAISYSKSLKVASFGNNMREVAVTDGDRVESQIKYGWECNYYALGDLVDIINQVTEEEIDAKMKEYTDKYTMKTDRIDSVREQAKYEVGLEKFLSILKMEGVWMYVATATHRRLTEKALKTAGIDHYFRGIVTSADAGNHKSESADIYEMAMRRLQSNKRDTVVFEDALHAIRTAKAAGFRVAGVYEATAEQDQPEIQRLCDYYIRSYEELVQSETF